MTDRTITFRGIRVENLPDRVRFELESAIEDGRLVRGQRLPSERTLAAQFGVSRVVVREALRALEATGLVEVRSGAGAFVAKTPGQVIRDGWASWLGRHSDEALELLSVRRSIEQLAAFRAASRVSDRDVVALERLCARFETELKKSKRNVERLVELDIEFHHRIAVAAGGKLIPKLVDELASVMRDSRRATFMLDGRAEATAPDHRCIVEALRRRDPKAAEHALAAHLSSVIDTVTDAAQLHLPSDERV